MTKTLLSILKHQRKQTKLYKSSFTNSILVIHNFPPTIPQPLSKGSVTQGLPALLSSSWRVGCCTRPAYFVVLVLVEGLSCGPRCRHRYRTTWACIVGVVVPLLLGGRHDPDDMGLCCVVGVMSLLSLCGWIRHDAAGHVLTSLACVARPCAHIVSIMLSSLRPGHMGLHRRHVVVIATWPTWH